MLKRNVKEYESIRQEIQATRTLATTFLSISMGGSGISYVALNGWFNMSDDLTIATFSFLVSAIICGFYYLALYSYQSHNRFAGYSKLINQEIDHKRINDEKTHPNYELPNDIMTWEICVSKWQNAVDKQVWDGELDRYWRQVLIYDSSNIQLPLLHRIFELYNFHKPRADRRSHIKGIWMLLSGPFKKHRYQSWKFPLYSSYVYYMLLFFYWHVGFSHFIEHLSTFNYQRVSFVNIWESMGVALLIISTLIMTWRSFSTIHKLMEGSKTVNAFCWMLLQHRIRILNKFNIQPAYYVSEKLVKDGVVLNTKRDNDASQGNAQTT